MRTESNLTENGITEPRTIIWKGMTKKGNSKTMETLLKQTETVHFTDDTVSYHIGDVQVMTNSWP